MKNPCYDEKTKTECSKRRVGCRSECAEWQDYLVERGRIYDARNFVREGSNMAADICHRRRERMRKKKRK